MAFVNSFLFFFLGFAYLLLLIWGIILSKKYGLLNLYSLLFLVIIGLVYDNIIIGLGKEIGEGNTLENLSYIRFWFHALFTPTLILSVLNICHEIGLIWARKAFWRVIFFILTIALILYELLTSVKGLELKPVWRNSVLTYEPFGDPNSPIMVGVVTLVLTIIGLIFLRKFHFPWLFISTMLIILGGILQIWVKNFPIMNVLELLLIVSLLLTKQFQVHHRLSPNI
ncbi:hypothetical protein NST02_19290 [Robertmurraya sp. FSL W8-0741]|uniref:hypothetical protein n=1 Tax=Robertmurraya sp. FSL W8-0741 TaxID=2954629 RepID=UPI0030F4EAB5